MALKVIGAGLGRTGTMSLKLALERLLGAPCYHMIEVFAHPQHVSRWTDALRGGATDWPDLFSGYAAAVDWPACALWPEVSEAFPDAIVLLSVRDPESWWESASQTIFPARHRAEGERREMVEAMFGERFTSRLDDREAAIAAFERHNQRVREGVPPDRLVEWRARDGWKPLCAAVGVAEPEAPFPHANTREDWMKRMGGG